MKRTQKGFTLVELLVVIGILAVLTAVVLVAVNPGRQFAQARNTQRRSDVATLSSAIAAYMADPLNNGMLPATIPACTAPGQVGSAGVDLATPLVPRYVAALPLDPGNGNAGTVGNATNTQYTVCLVDPDAKRVRVTAPNTELMTEPGMVLISVTR